MMIIYDTRSNAFVPFKTVNIKKKEGLKFLVTQISPSLNYNTNTAKHPLRDTVGVYIVISLQICVKIRYRHQAGGSLLEVERSVMNYL